MCRDARGLDDPSDLIRCQDYTKQYGDTGTHSAGKLTKTEVSGKEDKLIVGEERGQAPFIFLLPNLCFIIGCYFILFIYIQLKQEILVRHCT